MISADYEASTAWITSPDNVTITSATNSSSRDVFDRYTWTEFLQVCYDIVSVAAKDRYTPPTPEFLMGFYSDWPCKRIRQI